MKGTGSSSMNSAAFRSVFALLTLFSLALTKCVAGRMCDCRSAGNIVNDNSCAIFSATFPQHDSQAITCSPTASQHFSVPGIFFENVREHSYDTIRLNDGAAAATACKPFDQGPNKSGGTILTSASFLSSSPSGPPYFPVRKTFFENTSHHLLSIQLGDHAADGTVCKLINQDQNNSASAITGLLSLDASRMRLALLPTYVAFNRTNSSRMFGINLQSVSFPADGGDILSLSLRAVLISVGADTSVSFPADGGRLQSK